MFQNLAPDQRKAVSDKIMELANLAYVGLVLGQVLANQFDVIFAE